MNHMPATITIEGNHLQNKLNDAVRVVVDDLVWRIACKRTGKPRDEVEATEEDVKAACCQIADAFTHMAYHNRKDVDWPMTRIFHIWEVCGLV